jgi:hypothetical protein
LHSVVFYGRSRIDQTREHLESSRHYSAMEARPRLRRPVVLGDVLHVPEVLLLLGEARR